MQGLWLLLGTAASWSASLRPACAALAGAGSAGRFITCSAMKIPIWGSFLVDFASLFTLQESLLLSNS